jgi:hypothetical protein
MSLSFVDTVFRSRILLFICGCVSFGIGAAATYGIYYTVRGSGSMEYVYGVNYVNEFNMTNCKFQTSMPLPSIPKCVDVQQNHTIPVWTRCQRIQPGPPAGFLVCDYTYLNKTTATAHVGFMTDAGLVETRSQIFVCTGSILQVTTCITNQTSSIHLHNIRYSSSNPDKQNNAHVVWYTNSNVAPVSFLGGIGCLILAAATLCFVGGGFTLWFFAFWCEKHG